jgi:hypothetical protein
MKKSIEWHEETIKNKFEFFDLKIKEIEDLETIANKILNEINFLSLQIEEAKRLNLTEFDRDKFLVKRS